MTDTLKNTQVLKDLASGAFGWLRSEEHVWVDVRTLPHPENDLGTAADVIRALATRIVELEKEARHD